MRTLGIDLASQPKRTAACGIEWVDGTATVSSIEVGVDDGRALVLMDGVDSVGIDAPFGWPVPFKEMVRRHHAEGEPTPEWTPSYLGTLRFRRTDLRVRERLNMVPLSVSSDLIAITAMRCAGLLHSLGVVDRSGSGRVVEVYPAAALKTWELPWKGYKGAGKEDKRAKLLARLLEASPGLTVPSNLCTLCIQSDHAFDALVAALVARAAAVNLTERPDAADLRLARVEGWIAVPLSDSLASIAAAQPSPT